MRVALLLVLSFLINTVSAAPLTVVTEQWRPYNYVEQGELQGTSVEIVRTLLDRSQYPYHINVYPWARTYQTALKKPDTLIFTLIRLPVREKLFHWIGPLADTDHVGVYKVKSRGDVVVNSLEDLRKYRIGVVRDDMGHIYLKQIGLKDEKHLEPVTRQEINIGKLFAGRIDLVVYGKANILAEMESFGYQEVQLVNAFHLFSHTPYLAMSLGSDPKLVDELTQSYQALVKQGEIPAFNE